MFTVFWLSNNIVFIVKCIHFRYGVSDHVLTHKLVQYASQIPPSFDPIAPRKYSSSTWICGRKFFYPILLTRLLQLDYELEISWGRTQSQLSHIEIKTPRHPNTFQPFSYLFVLFFQMMSQMVNASFLQMHITSFCDNQSAIKLCYYKLHTNTNLLPIHSEKCSNNIWNPSSVNFQNLVVALPAVFQHIDWV